MRSELVNAAESCNRRSGPTHATSLEELSILRARAGWGDIAAVRHGRVYFVDGNAYCNRPGPRLAETTEILAEMLHPEAMAGTHRGKAWAHLQ